MENKDLLARIKEEGYKYAKNAYPEWREEILCDYDAEDPDCKDWLDENRNPKIELFDQHLYAQESHLYYFDSGDNQEFLDWLDIEVDNEGIEQIDSEELFKTVISGIDRFIKEHYEEK